MQEDAMSRTVAIGIQDYAKLITENLFYVDKTNFIKEWWESQDAVTLITRPRRFGKTLNINMLDYFFSNKHPNRGDLFEGLSIWKDEKYRTLQGTYPVISLTFANIKEDNYIKTREKICGVIQKLYIQNNFLMESDLLIEADKNYFKRILAEEIKDSDITVALHQLSDYLYRYYGKKAIILLDEYDTPMQEAYVNGYWDELVSLTRSMFNAAFKTNPYLERAIMTGITRVSKESIFSDLNNLKVITTTSDKYATSFGFTEEEVFTALDECGLSSEKEMVKKWYDGFTIGNHTDIYNPWSVLNFLSSGKYEPYWANSSGNRLVNKLIREGNKDIKYTFEKLLKGESILCPIDEQIVYNQLDENPEAIWSLLLASGYLKVLRYENLIEIPLGNLPNYELTLTNQEVHHLFLSMVKGWFNERKPEYNEFIRALLKDDLESMNEYMNEITYGIFSYFDTGSGSMRSSCEKFYHGFVLGLFVELRYRYHITSNRESGLGRYDVMLEPLHEEDDAIIMEFKVYNERRESSLEDTLASALAQIEEKQYEAALITKGIAKERIRKYGFAFKGKEVLIG